LGHYSCHYYYRHSIRASAL